MDLLGQIYDDRNKVLRLLHDDANEEHDPYNVPTPTFVSHSFMGNSVIRLFILKYSGDVDGSTTPAWVDQQFEFVNGIKVWMEQFIKQRESREED
jgi:hypothetical protein